jgi:hypothetical protein
MTITLAYLTTTVTLHPDLRWADENQFNTVEQTIQRTVTGALIVSSAARIAGRPITLQPEDESSAWMPQSTLDALRNFAVVPGRVMQLTLRGTSRDVIFRHHDGVALEAVPVVHYNDQDSADWHRITLRLMEI